jgi:hypothetical protein
MQLVATGAQDLFLTSNPDITFFKVNHRKYTNFSIESIEQTFSGSVDFGKKASVTVSRTGDLIHRTYLQVDLPVLTGSAAAPVAWVNEIGHMLINEVEIQIGGQTIDRHYGEWLSIWNQLTQTEEKIEGYNLMTNGFTTSISATSDSTITAGTLYIPLQFWFCRNPGLALPLIALQFHEVKFNVTFAAARDCLKGATHPTTLPVLGNASLFIDYIYLDTDERRQFTQTRHEYLIEQLQFGGSESFSATSFKSKLSFNHPCKELVWVLQDDLVLTAHDRSNFTNNTGGTELLVDAKLQLNGQDRFATRKARYFNQVQPYQHHTRCPRLGIYVYSFGLNPENFQPSGTVNMSRIDSAVLQITSAIATAQKLRVYAVNVNVLKIMSGLGGLSYSS